MRANHAISAGSLAIDGAHADIASLLVSPHIAMLLDDDKADAADQQGPGDRGNVFRQLEPLLLQDVTGAASEHKGEHEFGGVALSGPLAPAEQKLVEALVEEGNHRENRPGLNHDVKEVALADVEQTLGNEQMPGGGNRQKLSDSFYHSEQNNSNPVWHWELDDKRPQKTSPKCESNSEFLYGGKREWRSCGSRRPIRRYFFFFRNTEPMADLDASPRWRTFNWPRMACQPI